MNNNITEDYCSFEVSKLLKEKGFEIITFGTFTEIIPSFPDKITQIQYRNLIPTHALAIKWLIENFGIYIISAPNVEKSGFTWMGYNIKNNKNFDSFILPQDVWIFNTPKETTEAALLYTLQNLIP